MLDLLGKTLPIFYLGLISFSFVNPSLFSACPDFHLQCCCCSGSCGFQGTVSTGLNPGNCCSFPSPPLPLLAGGGLADVWAVIALADVVHHCISFIFSWEENRLLEKQLIHQFLFPSQGGWGSSRVGAVWWASSLVPAGCLLCSLRTAELCFSQA